MVRQNAADTLNSNKIKSDAFYNSVIEYGRENAEWLKRFNVENGGVSRYEKYQIFVEQKLNDDSPETIEVLLEKYSEEVKSKLLTCEVSEALYSISTHKGSWAVISGSDQNELREILKKRGIHKLFDGGIYGSPRNKYEIISQEIPISEINPDKVLLIGDSKLDAMVAKKFRFQFAFVADWSEIDSSAFEEIFSSYFIFETLNQLLEAQDKNHSYLSEKTKIH